MRLNMLYVYGPRTGDPVLLSGSDAGWLQLVPRVARRLADRGFFVVGMDIKRYLSAADEEMPKDYRRIVQFASWVTGKKPTLVGLAEGAGLSILAATDPHTKGELRGVVAIGMPDLKDLGVRWRDAVIHLTHRRPAELMNGTAAIVRQVAPLPLAAIQSAHDAFVPSREVMKILAQTTGPTRLWVVGSGNHGFGRGRGEIEDRLLEAIAWVAAKSLQ